MVNRAVELVENLISPRRFPANDLLTESRTKANQLSDLWAKRQSMMQDWYKAIRLDDYLEQEDMESFISNRPKNVMRLARHLLNSASVTHKPEVETLSDSVQVLRPRIERSFRNTWKSLNKKHRKAGRQGWTWEFAGLLVTLGWYSVFLDIDDSDAKARIWNPYQVFPLWDDQVGLIEVVRRYDTTAEQATRQLERTGLPVPNFDRGRKLSVIDLWEMENGIPVNTLIYGDEIIKGRVPHSDRGTIPVLVGPAGGMPDKGVLPNNPDWAGTWGESIIAANMGVLRNYNKFFSFLMQMVRDSANPRWVEFVSGSGGVLDPDTMFKRGGVFTAGSEDRVEPLAGPALPVEATTSLQDMNSDLEQGDFPDAALGNPRQPMSSIMLSQTLSATQMVLDPYLTSLKEVYESTDEWWYSQMKKRGVKPDTFDLPLSSMPKELDFDVSVLLSLPGDLTNRATQARMLAPNYQMSEEIVEGLLFSAEIEDHEVEQARKQAERASKHPVAQDIELIAAFEQMATEASLNNNTKMAQRYTKAAQSIEANLGQRVGGQQPEQVGPSTQVQPNSPFEAR